MIDFLHRCAHSMTLYEAMGDAWASSKDGDLGWGAYRPKRKKIASKPETSTIFLASKRLGQAGQSGW